MKIYDFKILNVKHSRKLLKSITKLHLVGMINENVDLIYQHDTISEVQCRTHFVDYCSS